MHRRAFTAGAALFAAAGAPNRLDHRDATLRVLIEAAPNSFDQSGSGVNRQALLVTWNCYDRLLRFGTKPGPDGMPVPDESRLEGELAARVETAADQCSHVFHLRRDAVFHDGSPVTSADVVWSLHRVLASPVGRAQLATGSITDPADIVALDAHTVRITTQRPDRYTLPNLAAVHPVIVNAALARAHATEADPWAREWLRGNVAGGGAFRVDAHVPGQTVLLSRFEGWRGGEAPGFASVVLQVAPEPQTRRAALERGDADLVADLPPQDVRELGQNAALRVMGAPAAGAFQFIGMNPAIPPFDDVRVRQAVAHALPYEAMFQAALFGRGRPLFGTAEAGDTAFPQPLDTRTDPARARALLAEAGLAQGFETTLSFEASLATVAEPACLLAQEALAAVGIRARVEKVPAGQLGTLLEQKRLPLFFEGSAALLGGADYFFRIFYTGRTRWNFGSYDSPAFLALLERLRFETDPAIVEPGLRRLIATVKRDMPVVLLWQPAQDAGMQRSVAGYRTQFHRMLDVRPLRRVGPDGNP